MQPEEETEILLHQMHMEALIGAVYLDGGFANAKEFIHKFVLKRHGDIKSSFMIARLSCRRLYRAKYCGKYDVSFVR